MSPIKRMTSAFSSAGDRSSRVPGGDMPLQNLKSLYAESPDLPIFTRAVSPCPPRLPPAKPPLPGLLPLLPNLSLTVYTLRFFGGCTRTRTLDPLIKRQFPRRRQRLQLLAALCSTVEVARRTLRDRCRGWGARIPPSLDGFGDVRQPQPAARARWRRRFAFFVSRLIGGELRFWAHLMDLEF